MYFEASKSILYSDTLIPDIFITEYMPSMDGDSIKVYIQCLFLSKHNKQISTEEFSKKLALDINRVKDIFLYLQSLGIINWNENGVVLCDLKEKEISRVFRPKATSTPEEALVSVERNKKRNSVITSINSTFFQGLMSPSWFTDIDTWFDRYSFDEDVMYALFQHCYNHKGLSKQYIMRVAESWFNKNIRDYFELERHLEDYNKFKDIRGLIIKKLKLNRNLTEYEDEYVEMWVMDYKYGFDIIELALKKTTAKTSPNIKYIHAVISDWNKNGLRTREEIIMWERNKKPGTKEQPARASAIPQKGNFEQRKYDKDYFESLYEKV